MPRRLGSSFRSEEQTSDAGAAEVADVVQSGRLVVADDNAGSWQNAQGWQPVEARDYFVAKGMARIAATPVIAFVAKRSSGAGTVA